MTMNCDPAPTGSAKVFDGTPYFGARHMAPGTRVCLKQHPYISATVQAAHGLERTVLIDPLFPDEDLPAVPAWLPHTHSGFPADPDLRETLPVQALAHLKNLW